MNTQTFPGRRRRFRALLGPASTQLSIFCAYRVAGPAAAYQRCRFILPAVILVLLLSLLFLAAPAALGPRAGAGAGAALPPWRSSRRGLIGPSFDAPQATRAARWVGYLTVGAAAAALLGAYLVLVLLASGSPSPYQRRLHPRLVGGGPTLVAVGGIGALAWTALRLVRSLRRRFRDHPPDARGCRHSYHWMTNPIPDAVALEQITPGPVVATVAPWLAAHRWPGGSSRRWSRSPPGSRSSSWAGGASSNCATTTAPGPSWMAPGLPRSGRSWRPRSCSPEHFRGWQFAVLAAAVIALLMLKRGIVETLLGAERWAWSRTRRSAPSALTVVGSPASSIGRHLCCEQ